MAPYDCIFINGDSYSMPADDIKVYGDLLGEWFDAPVKNHALRGSNNDRILRTSVELLQQLKANYTNPLVVIGWSFIDRAEIWEDRSNLSSVEHFFEQDCFPGSRFITLDHLLNADCATTAQKAMAVHDQYGHKQLMDFYTNCYLLAHLLELWNFDCLFFSAADNQHRLSTDYPAIDSHALVSWVKNSSKFYQLDRFHIKQWAQANDPNCTTTGHMSKIGHEKFAKLLVDIVKEQYGTI